MKPSELFMAVRSVVNREDPIALLDIGAPEYEYDIEVRDLIKLTMLNSTPVTTKQVEVIFLYWFGEVGEIPSDMAERIANGVNQARAQHPQTHRDRRLTRSRRGWFSRTRRLRSRR